LAQESIPFFTKLKIFAKAFAQPSGTPLGFILCPALQNLAPSILPDFIIQTAQKVRITTLNSIYSFANLVDWMPTRGGGQS
jgi:hypothetical protein